MNINSPTDNLISIVTVCFNSEKTVDDTIQSVLNQSYQQLEYIIVDGGSTDRTLEIIAAYEKEAKKKGIIYKWISEADNGIYDAMNKGIQMSTGQYIGILNSDDWYKPDAVENIVNAISSDEPIITGERSKYTFEKRYRKTIGNNPDIEANVHRHMPVNHPSTFIPKSVYNKIGLFNTRYRLSADYDFIFRCVKHKVPFRKLNVVLTCMRDDGATAKNKNLFITAKEDYLIRRDFKVRFAQYYYLIKLATATMIIIRNTLRKVRI